MHQLDDAERTARGLVPVAVLDAAASDLAQRASLKLEHGEDDLGAFVSAMFRLPSGREAAVLERVPPEPPGVQVLIDVDEDDVTSTVGELLRGFGLDRTSLRAPIDTETSLDPLGVDDVLELVRQSPALQEDVARLLVSRALSARPAQRKGVDLLTPDGVALLVAVAAPAATALPLLAPLAAIVAPLFWQVARWFTGKRQPDMTILARLHEEQTSSESLADAWRFYVMRGAAPPGMPPRGAQPVALEALPEAVREATRDRLAA
jgi:hypothetical protein